MFQNYLKLAFRNLSRNRLYTLLNILGLGVGITLIFFAGQNKYVINVIVSP